MALGYQNPFYLKQAQQKQQSLYNGKVLLEKHDPPDVYDLEETLQLAQESRLKMKQLNKEIKPANYAKINQLLEDTTHGTSTNNKFAKQSILGKRLSFSRQKLYAVTPLPKSKAISKIDESHALSKPVTSNSVHTSTESKVVKNDNVISPELFRINPFKASRREKTQSANVSKSANQKKDKPKIWKPKKVRFKERLASPKPSTPRSCLRWSPTRRLFDLKGKLIATNESECQSDCFKGDNACTSNPQEPISKRFPNSTFSMTCGQNWFDALLIPLLSEYKPKDKEYHGDNECDT
ncbi:hypothetical protein Tco_1303142 [Tanacetum coccineum]